jgi:serine protease
MRLTRLCVCALVCAALVLTASVRDTRAQRAQLRPSTRIVQPSSLPPIDRGFIGTDAQLGRHGRTTVPGRPPDRIGVGGRRYAAGRVIVKFRASRTADVAEVDANADAEALARSLAARGDVEYAQADYRVEPRAVPNDPLYGTLQWNLRQIDLERAWDIQGGLTGANSGAKSVVVAVVDTGVAYENAMGTYRGFAFPYKGVIYPALGTVTVPFGRAPDLAASGSQGDARFVSPRDFIWQDTHPHDTDGHGTHVASTLAELTNNNVGLAGVAFNVKLMPVKVLSTMWDDIFLSPVEGTDSVVAQGIRYAADNGADIINMSLGRTGFPAPAVEDAINYAVGKGVFVVIAGGNIENGDTSLEVYAEIASRVKGAVSVAAVDAAQHRASYSKTGSWIELAAPGGSSQIPNGFVYQQTYDLNLVNTFDLPGGVAAFKAPRFDFFTFVGAAGTSMAAPHVAGLAALLIQQGVKSPAAIEAALEKFATDLGAAGRDNEYGYGEINARATLLGLGLAR